MGQSLTKEQANAIWDVLVEHAGASDDWRIAFYFTQTDSCCTEYRFQGSLGFGGKFWNYDGRWYVTAYPEDVQGRPERQQALDDTNAALAVLKAERMA